jgi:hypothetical protein
MQARAPSQHRPPRPPTDAAPRLGLALLGDPATWVRRHLTMLAAAELLTHVAGRLPGALGYATACLLLLNHQLALEVTWRRPGTLPAHAGPRGWPVPSPVFLLLGIVALGRLTSLTTNGFSTVWFGGYAFASLPLALALRRFTRLTGWRPAQTWGDPSWRQARITAAAVPLALLGVLTSRPRPVLDWWDLNWQLWAVVGLFAASGVVDEVLYQAVLRPFLGTLMGTSGAASCVFLYAVTHGDVEPGLLAAMLAATVVFRVGVERTGLLVGACTGHALFNVLVVLVLPYWLPH